MLKITREQMVEWLEKKIEWATNYLNDLNLRESESAESSLLREDIEMLGAILSALAGLGEEEWKDVLDYIDERIKNAPYEVFAFKSTQKRLNKFRNLIMGKGAEE